MLNTPVLLIIFNRPESTDIVFEEIRKQKPKQLFIAADGPRKDNSFDKELCAKTREVVHKIDWDCDYRLLFSDVNLGCGLAPSTAMTWFFNQVEYGIILEDDCLPNEYFFSFCEELLVKFKDDVEIMHISGANLNDTVKYGDGSYFYSKYANIWGWATWNRAWSHFEFNLREIDEYLSLIKTNFRYKSEREFWFSRIDLINDKMLDAWDYQWMLAIWKANGICINSNYNLVENIGFGINATHTQGPSPFKNKKSSILNKINHPKERRIIIKAEENFIYLLHGIKRLNSIQLFLKKNLIQRFINLDHKLRLLINK